MQTDFGPAVAGDRLSGDVSHLVEMEGHEQKFTRRLWLGGLAAASLAGARAQLPPVLQVETPRTQAESDLLSHLRQGHPRLLLLDSELDRVRLEMRDHPLAKRLFADLEKEAERLQTTLPVEYKLTGTRLLTQSRRLVDRVGTLALAFRLTAREHYLHRAVLELRAAASFKDWNPAHFLDVAEMTHGFAIGYDWLYPALSFEERAWMAGALVNKGLDPALIAYQTKAAWTTSKYNWNAICNCGIAMGALAVAEDFAPKSAAILKNVLESLPRCLPTWGTDGGWPEGPTYGEAAMRAASILLAAFDSAMGTDFGLSSSMRGFDRAGRYRVYTTSPATKTFNFGDAVDDVLPAPEMQWLARRFNNPVFAWSEQRVAERTSHVDFYDLMWFAHDARPPQTPLWPLDAVFHSVNVATFRSSWEDPNGIFLAVKGGDNKPPHTHFDLGSFVLDAGGVRFSLDPGAEDIPAAAPPQNAPATTRVRTTSYRVRTEAHNTLLIDGENQDGNAEARITRQEFGPELSWVQIDLSKANGTKTRMWQRRIGIAQRQVVLLEDVLESDRPIDVLWGMLSDAEISLSGQSAVLQKGKWSMAAEIRSPRHAVFDVVPVRTQGVTTYRKLIVRIDGKVTDLRLSVVFTPYKTGSPKPKTSAQFPA